MASSVSYNIESGDVGKTNFLIPFPYLLDDNDLETVVLFRNGIEEAVLSWPDTDTAVIAASVLDDLITFSRTTPVTPLVDFVRGSFLGEDELNRANLQTIYLAEEASDRSKNLINLDLADNKWDLRSRILKNGLDPVDPQDIVTKAWVETDVESSVVRASAEADRAEIAASNVASTKAEFDLLEGEQFIDLPFLVDAALRNYDVTLGGITQDASSMTPVDALDVELLTGPCSRIQLGGPLEQDIHAMVVTSNTSSVGDLTALIEKSVGNNRVVVQTIEELRTLTGVAGASVDVLGYYEAGDGGGGPTRVWDGVQAPGFYVDNKGSIITLGGTPSTSAWLSSEKTEPVSLYGKQFNYAVAAAKISGKSVFIDTNVDLLGATIDCTGVTLLWTDSKLIQNGRIENVADIIAPPVQIFSDSITISAELSIINVVWFGLDSTAMVNAADCVAENSLIDFGSFAYTLSASDFSDFSSIHGNVAFEVEDKKNITIKADRASINVVEHDIALYGGLLAFDFTDCNGLNISGIDFDMSYVNFKDDANLYPYCGAILIDDSVYVPGELSANKSGNIHVDDCTFKLYHPYGTYVTTTNPYLGDPNNGYKLFTVTALGTYQGRDYAEANRNITIEKCTLKEGHNGYGFWVWAYNNTKFLDLTAESFTAKSTSTAGVQHSGSGIPFIRHHQFGAIGVMIKDCNFRSRPSSERTLLGFEGGSSFCNLTTNYTGEEQMGITDVSGNTIILGNGDLIHTSNDVGILGLPYGTINIHDNIFDGHDGDVGNEFVGTFIQFPYSSYDNGGVASLNIHDNMVGANAKYINGIEIISGSEVSDSYRRLQLIKVNGNTFLSHKQFAISIFSGRTFEGAYQMQVCNNIINGLRGFYPNTAPGSSGIILKSTATIDMIDVSNNIIRYEYTGIAIDDVSLIRQVQNNLYHECQINEGSI